jgi:multidrug efflux pump subunit AcrA (membrane-fusion protein)
VLIPVDGKATYRPITLGPAVGDKRIVTSGLQAGEKIILEIAKVYPTMEVKPIEPEAAPAPGEEAKSQ